MPVKYVFWDSDNTLVDTFTHHWNKHLHTLKSHGITLDEQWKNRIYTNNGAQNWEWLRAELGLKVPKQDYLDQIDSWYYKNADSIHIRSGVLDALKLFDDAGVPMCVVSNGRTRSVMAALKAKDLVKRFKFVLCVEDYEGRKPDPAPYLAGMTRMRQMLNKPVYEEDCLAIEDDPKGVEAARAAGMSVIHRNIGDDDPIPFLRIIKSYLE